MISHRSRILATLALPLALVACGSKDEGAKNLDSLDNELVGNAATDTDPALQSALHDQIMVDPTLAQQSNDDAIRPPKRPYSGAVPPDGIGRAGQPVDTAKLKSAPAPSADCPQCTVARQSLTLGALAEAQGRGTMARCTADMHYSARWAARLPKDVPLYPDAQVSEAAGANKSGCALRAVSFASAAPIKTVIDWYYTRMTAAGYSAGHQADGAEHVLGGTRQRDDGAYVLFLKARADGGTDVDLIANNGT